MFNEEITIMTQAISDLQERVEVLEQGRGAVSKYSHVYSRLEKLNISESVTIKTDSKVESCRIASCVPGYYKNDERSFRTLSEEKFIVITRVF